MAIEDKSATMQKFTCFSSQKPTSNSTIILRKRITLYGCKLNIALYHKNEKGRLVPNALVMGI